MTRNPERIAKMLPATDAPKADPTREPIAGFNPVVTATLKACAMDADGVWQMTLAHGENGVERYGNLIVPAYLAGSARAASDILNCVASRQEVQGVSIKLLNVHYGSGRFRFPGDPNEAGMQYPMIVVQPSYLVNVTALAQFDYCPRNYLMDRYAFAETNQAMQRGTLVHSVFDFMLRHPDEAGGADRTLSHGTGSPVAGTDDAAYFCGRTL